MSKIYLLVTLLLFTFSSIFAQCDLGEVEVEFILYTDDYGYEIYWELLPSGNNCGDGFIASGGNELEVGCDGANDEDANGGNGYDSNSSYEVGPWCLTEGEFYDIIFVDDYTDGGLVVEVYEDGELTHFYTGAGDPTIWTFQAGFPTTPDNDTPCGAQALVIDDEPTVLDNTDAIASVDEVSPGGGGCETFGLWCEGNVTNSLWYTITAPASGSIQISTCNEGTELDTQIALYAVGDCSDYDTYELISSNDDAYGGCSDANVYASVMYASCLTPGEDYYIQLDGWDGATGVAVLSVTTYEEPLGLEAFTDNVDCPNVKGDDSGSILLLAFGTGVDYSATWTGPDGYTGSGIFQDNLVAGEYTVELLTSCGETASATFVVDVPNPIDIAANVDQATCEGSSNGMIDLSVSGANEPYDYFWSGPGGFTSTDQDPEGLSPGNYSVLITDDNDCQFNQNVAVGFEEEFQFSLGEDAEICLNETYFLTGPAGYDYSWQDGSENQFYIVDGSVLGAGTYPIVLTASNDIGCEYTDAVFITVNNCTDINDIDLSKLQIYPNPSSGLVYVDGLEGVKPASLTVYDLSGRMVENSSLSGDGARNWVDLSTLGAGIYILNLDIDGVELSTRIAIQ